MDFPICQAPFCDSLNFFQKRKPGKRASLSHPKTLQKYTNPADEKSQCKCQSTAGQQFVPHHPDKPWLWRTLFRMFSLSFFGHTAPPFHHSLKSRLLSAPIYDAEGRFVRLCPVNPHNNEGRLGTRPCQPRCLTAPGATVQPTPEVPHEKLLQPYRPVPAARFSVPLLTGQCSGGESC